MIKLDVPHKRPERPPRSTRRPSRISRSPSPTPSNLTPPSGSDGYPSEDEENLKYTSSTKANKNLFNVPLPASYIPDRQSSLVRPEAKPPVPSRMSSLTVQQQQEQDRLARNGSQRSSSNKSAEKRTSIWQTLRRTSTQSQSHRLESRKKNTLSLFSFPRRAISSSNLHKSAMSNTPISPTSSRGNQFNKPQRYSSLIEKDQIPTIDEDPIKDIRDDWVPIQAWLSNVEPVNEEDEARTTKTFDRQSLSTQNHGFLTDDATDYSLHGFNSIIRKNEKRGSMDTQTQANHTPENRNASLIDYNPDNEIEFMKKQDSQRNIEKKKTEDAQLSFDQESAHFATFEEYQKMYQKEPNDESNKHQTSHEDDIELIEGSLIDAHIVRNVKPQEEEIEELSIDHHKMKDNQEHQSRDEIEENLVNAQVVNITSAEQPQEEEAKEIEKRLIDEHIIDNEKPEDEKDQIFDDKLIKESREEIHEPSVDKHVIMEDHASENVGIKEINESLATSNEAQQSQEQEEEVEETLVDNHTLDYNKSQDSVEHSTSAHTVESDVPQHQQSQEEEVEETLLDDHVDYDKSQKPVEERFVNAQLIEMNAPQGRQQSQEEEVDEQSIDAHVVEPEQSHQPQEVDIEDIDEAEGSLEDFVQRSEDQHFSLISPSDRADFERFNRLSYELDIDSGKDEQESDTPEMMTPTGTDLPQSTFSHQMDTKDIELSVAQVPNDEEQLYSLVHPWYSPQMPYATHTQRQYGENLDVNKRMTLLYGDILRAEEAEKLHEDTGYSPNTLQSTNIPSYKHNSHSPYIQMEESTDGDLMTIEDSLQGFCIDNVIGQAY
ncbi:hypothetical protein E3Q19_04146 [Wallemia mellicola]|nr:hypothetical protein E3Q19_04146 [Wallemia mellicola]